MNIKGNVNLQCSRDVIKWGEEEKRLFVFLRNVCPSSSLVLSVEKKPLVLKFSEIKSVLSQVVAAVVFRRNFKLNLLKAKLMFTAC